MPPTPLNPTDREKLTRCVRLLEEGRLVEAREQLMRLAQKLPSQPMVLAALGDSLTLLKGYEQGLYYIERAIALDPDQPRLRMRRAHILTQLGRVDDAATELSLAACLAPGDLDAALQLITACGSCNRLTESKAASLRAIARFGPVPQIVHQYAMSVLSCGEPAAARDIILSALREQPEDLNLLCLLAFVSNYLPGVSREEVFSIHRRYARLLEAFVPKRDPPETDLDPERRLNVGFVSGDTYGHSVAYFLEPLLGAMDKSHFRTHVYAVAGRRDRVTLRLEQLADMWRDMPRPVDEVLRRQIVEDRIDVLVDLSGLTSGNRMPIFATRAAPVQATYLGYCNTTGLSVMDWRIVDSLTDPPARNEGESATAADGYCTERLWRLDPCFLCYRPLDDAPDVRARPTSGPVVFGSFNSLSKVSDEVLALWARVLEAVPGSTLICKNMALRDEGIRAATHARAKAQGIDPARLVLHPPATGPKPHLDMYGGVDIALDTFPYAGTTTTCEALHMGVAVVTLAGDRHCSRVGLSLLHAVGLSELVAGDKDDYVRIACRLAGDRAGLAGLRASMRERLASSVLRDEGGFGRRFGGAIRSMWRERCRSAGVVH